MTELTPAAARLLLLGIAAFLSAPAVAETLSPLQRAKEQEARRIEAEKTRQELEAAQRAAIDALNRAAKNQDHAARQRAQAEAQAQQAAATRQAEQQAESERQRRAAAAALAAEARRKAQQAAKDAAQRARSIAVKRPTLLPQPSALPIELPSPAPTAPSDAFGIDMRTIPAGQFLMGSEDDNPDEQPRHPVFLHRFKLGTTEVTQAQWRAVMGSAPAELQFKNCGSDCPVEGVSFERAQAFINRLNRLTGKAYRLPTEAEWEYACRAGRDSAQCGGNDADAVAWHRLNANAQPHPVAAKAANPWGLHDMSGNVWEWTCSAETQRYDGSETRCALDPSARRIVRGGSWFSPAPYLRPAFRNWHEPDKQMGDLGFRLAHD